MGTICLVSPLVLIFTADNTVLVALGPQVGTLSTEEPLIIAACGRSSVVLTATLSSGVGAGTIFTARRTLLFFVKEVTAAVALTPEEDLRAG